jgi:hypothetical protein
VTFLDVRAAKAHHGVVEVMTPANRPPLADDPDAKTNPFMFRLDVLQNDRVRYANQSIAVVIAETLESATEGAAPLSPRYEAEPARAGLEDAESFIPPDVGIGNPSVVRRGDVDVELATAAHRIEATYETSAQFHNAMEPHAIVAAWHGDSLSIDTPSQGLVMAQGRPGGAVRDRAGENPHSQPFPGRRLRLQGARQRTAGPRHSRGQTRRQAGQTGASSGADVRPCRPSATDATDPALGSGQPRRAERHRSSHEDGLKHL